MLKLKPVVIYSFFALYYVLLNIFVLHPPFDVFTPPSNLKLDSAMWENHNRKVDLPHYWHDDIEHIEFEKADGSDVLQSYSIRFDASDIPNFSEVSLSIYLPHVTHNAAVYLNGIWLGQGGHFISPVSRHHNEPLFLPSRLILLNHTAMISQ